MSSQDVKSSKEQRSSTDVSQESSKHVDGSIERLQLKSSTYRSGSQYVFTFVCAVIASLAALAILRRKDPTTELPDAYAVCARESKIYTVDGGSPQVECIGVRAGEIFATGPIGEKSLRILGPFLIQLYNSCCKVCVEDLPERSPRNRGSQSNCSLHTSRPDHCSWACGYINTLHLCDA
jgi:hypothetical protein